MNKLCKHNNVVLVETIHHDNDNLTEIYLCDKCDRKTKYSYELKMCVDIKGENEYEHKGCKQCKGKGVRE